MLPLVLMLPLALLSLDLVAPWPSGSSARLVPVLVPHGWAPEAVMSRRLTWDHGGDLFNAGAEEEELKKELEAAMNGQWGSGSDGMDGHHEAEAGMMLISMMTLTAISIGACVGQLVFACKYKQDVADKRPHLDQAARQLPSGDFENGPFACFDDCHTCMHAFFCTCCRAGDTFQAAGIQQYWTVIGIFVLAFIVADIVSSFVASFMGANAHRSHGEWWRPRVRETPCLQPHAYDLGDHHWCRLPGVPPQAAGKARRE
ncbi:unnamed protein product [Prorocentrum cordatum]|uniref:Uncharacterized protein n=1 Tax=Prorocentrum cordatum TaxID=2364126 RepID=A0ABN9R9Y0_9DINO|nr:unnamed protein product [Polarella glacialis]